MHVYVIRLDLQSRYPPILSDGIEKLIFRVLDKWAFPIKQLPFYHFVSNRLTADNDASLGQQILNIAMTQIEAIVRPESRPQEML